MSAPNSVGASADSQPVVRRVALVTGASGGIGSAIARRLATDGFQLALTGRRADALAEVAASLASETGAEPFAAAADLTSGDQVASLIDAVRERHGRIDAVVNTAGGWSGSRIGPFVDKTEAELRAELENNLFTTVLVCHAVLPLMIAQRYGRIVNVSSIAGLIGLRGHSVYAAAKAGQIGLARVLATELGEAGITVNCVAPGPVGTPRVQQSLAAGRPGLLEMIQLTPNRRLAAPEEVADAVAYLASERAGHVNGQVVAVDGGMTIY